MRMLNRLRQLFFVCFVFVFFGEFPVQNAVAADRSITLNDGQHIQVNMPIGKVFISAPDIADYKIINETTFVVYANKIGQARLVVYGTDSSVLLSDRILVDLNLSEVRRQIKFHFPDANVKVESVGEQVSVSGVVGSEKVRDDIYRLVATLLKRKKVVRWENSEKLAFVSEDSDSRITEPESMIFARNMTWEGIIERIEIGTTQQVNVKISIAHVTESFGQTIGIDWNSIGESVGSFSFNQFDAANLSTVITALGNDTIAEVLAEPNLTVLSGESASFLSGGEVPVIVSNDGNVSITFKQFGIGLNLTAKVLSRERIQMQLTPSVSEVVRYIETSGLRVPELSLRQAFTTVELADGDSFILGGLMNSADFETMKKVPVIGDIPLFGAAFRRAETERKRTELIMVATVNLVEPMKSKDIQIPYINKTSTLGRWLNIDLDDNSKPSSDATIRLLSEGGFIQ